MTPPDRPNPWKPATITRLVPLSTLVTRLGVSRTTAWRWCTAGKIPGARRVGRSWRVPFDVVRAIADGELVIDPAAP